MSKVKFPLEMANGVHVRTIEELKDNFDINKVVGYFLEGKLQTWLADRYYDEEAERIDELTADDTDIARKICTIFGVEYTETENVDIDKIKSDNERITKIKLFTDDEEIIKNIDSVAFTQEELAVLYDKGIEKIYLCEGFFSIPKSKSNLEYIVLGEAQVKGINSKTIIENEDMLNNWIKQVVSEAEEEIGNPLEFSEEVVEAMGEIPSVVVQKIVDEEMSQGKSIADKEFINILDKFKKLDIRYEI